MVSRQTIVVGIDGSLAAHIALDWAIAEAHARGWPVHVVHAWSVGAATDFAWLSATELRAQSEAMLAEALRDTDTAGVEVTWSAVEGDPASVLLEASRGGALLVLAAHQGMALSGRPPGSVTAACLREAAIPVVVVPPAYANGEVDESDRPHRRADEAIPRRTGSHRARP